MTQTQSPLVDLQSDWLFGINWTLVLTVTGLIVAVGVGIATILATRRYGSRETVLIIGYRLRPLQPLRIFSGDSGEVEVINPNPLVQFDVEIQIENHGPGDVLRAQFDEKPLTFWFGTKVAPVHSSNLVSGFLNLGDEEASLFPRNIPRGNSLHFIVRTINTRPTLRVTSPINNVNVRLRRHKDKPANVVPDFTIGRNRSSSWLRQRVRRY